MEFGLINLIGAIIVAIMMIPNIFFAHKSPVTKNDSSNKIMEIVEQVGRYGCVVLMWLPLFVWKFGFNSVPEMIVYAIGVSTLLGAYIIIWIFYYKEQSMKSAVALAVIPTMIFLLCGILLRHWLLAFTAILFGIGHIYVTVKNHL